MPKKILVVDDEPHILKIVQMRLKASKFDVITGENGKEALQKVRDEKPDLIVLDVMMPPPDGFQVCRILKEDPQYKHIPIVLLTAKSSESDKLIGKKAGANAYVTKPYSAKELLSTVTSLVGV